MKPQRSIKHREGSVSMRTVVKVGGAALLATVVLLAGCNDATGKEAGAESVCKKAVKSELKSPGSAKFHDVSVSSTGDNEWDVSGNVDSQNGFGALLRSSWTCTATLDGDTFHATSNVTGQS